MLRFFAAGRFLFLLMLLSCAGFAVPAQAQTAADSLLAIPPPKRELRGMWVATVENIDWPNQRGETPEQYRR